LSGQGIDDPVLFPFGGYHASTTQVSEVLGNLDLRFTKNVLKMTDAERRFCKKIENAQSRAIAEALINLDQVHADLTTSRGRGATVSCCFEPTTLARPTLRPAALQDQVQVLAIRCYFDNWILRYDAAIVFDLYIQICTRNDAISESQDLRKPVRWKPVIGVIADVRLQHDLFLFSG
jgi:hypothetical protein